MRVGRYAVQIDVNLFVLLVYCIVHTDNSCVRTCYLQHISRGNCNILFDDDSTSYSKIKHIIVFKISDLSTSIQNTYRNRCSLKFIAGTKSSHSK